jgi:hypothetical protein
MFCVAWPCNKSQFSVQNRNICIQTASCHKWDGWIQYMQRWSSYSAKKNSAIESNSAAIYVYCTYNHRYLISRLSLQVVYLWRHVSSTAPPFILWWSNFEILFGPLHRSSPFIGELRCQAIQTEHGPYIAERTQKEVYIVRFLCVQCIGWTT